MLNRVGQQFGNYRLLRLLGSGGFAEVYLGEHVYMQSNAAVKVLHGPLATNDTQSFLQEARMLASLEHTNIVGIKEFDIKQGIPFLVMNYASNGTLRQRYPRRQRVPLVTIVSYVLQVASALQYAHDRQIVHRDVKPENMLISNNGNIFLSDFGIAVLASSSHSYGSKGQVGTHLYMAPEQITGKALPASDQYALAVTAYEWVCGETPFVGSLAEVTAKHLYAPPPSFRDRGIAIEPQVERVISHALEKDPRRRFASVREFALALQSSSNAQQRNSIYSPASGNDNSLLISPSNKTPGFTYPIAPTPPIQPRLTPHITHSVQPPTSGLPSSPIAPTIYPGNVQYTPTRPAPQYVQNRKNSSLCLPTSLIIILLLIIVVGSAFAIRNISTIFTTTPGLTGSSPTSVPTTKTARPIGSSPTSVPITETTGPTGSSPTSVPTTGTTPVVLANITVSPQTLTATNGNSTADCDYWDPSFGTGSGWTCKIMLQNNGQNMVTWYAKTPTDSRVDLRPSSTGFLEAGGNWEISVHIPLKDCPGSIDITITPEGGTSQKVTWACS